MTIHRNAAFEVDSLKPESIGGASGKSYQLTATTVSPVRIVGRDALGRPKEDTLPTVAWRYMVHPKGAIDKVPIRTASVFSMEPEAERYEQIIMRDLISNGWIPLEMCPYSTEYTHLTHGPFVEIPPGERACKGKEGGCDHMLRVIDLRRSWAKQVYDDDHARVYAMKNEDAQKMIDGISEGVGAALARHLTDVRANKQKLREGRGEPETP